MIIHVIESGETVYTIANKYGVSAEWIVRENGILEPSDLAVGGSLVILFPKLTHEIVEGETLEKIASIYNVTIMDLLRNNSYLTDQEYLNIGDIIVIEYEDEKISNLSVFGYCYHFTEDSVLRKTLPYLTYLIIFSFVIDEHGQSHELDDNRIIESAKLYGVAPIMIITLNDQDGVSRTDIFHLILNNESLRNSTIEGIINTLVRKGYSGISLGPLYIYPSDRQLYIEYMQELVGRVKDLGLLVIDTIVPQTFALISDVFSTQNYIHKVNQLLDFTIIFPISVGITLVAPSGVASYNALLDMMNYVLDFIPSQTMQLGINTVGYIWELPYVPGVSEGNAISVNSAIQLARDYSIPILFDEGTQAAFFRFEDGDREYLIRFRDTRSIVKYMDVVNEYDLNGIGVWNINSFFNGLWLIVNSQYYIDKVDL